MTLLSEEEARIQLHDFQGKKLAYDQQATFLDLFAKTVEERVNEIALVDVASKLTYRETNVYAEQLAKKLVALGVTANFFVGIMLPRKKEFVLGVLAIMKAGGAYLPLDSSYPKERLEYMLMDSEAQVLITERKLFEEKGGCDSFSIKNIVFIEEFCFGDAAEPIPSVELIRPVLDDLAYMIYTSGSTGKPKGVMISHKALAAFLAWRVQEYELMSDDHICCHSSFSFDASVYDLFPPLVSGGQLHIISEDMRYDMVGFYEYIITNKITHCILTTQFGMELLRQFDVPLKTITLGGEKLHIVPKRNVRLINAYGPTEFTIVSNYYEVDQDQSYDNIPIGKPVPNSWAYVLDTKGSLLPIGMPGELCLSGLQIANGYWHRPELTQEKFVDNPYQTCTENACMYHTGDLACWNRKGELEYLGRIDNQVKLRGFRIELGEIEVAIGSFDHIIDAVVDIKEINGMQHLCGYFTADRQIDVKALAESLSGKLTEYMVPTVLMQMDKIPLTPNGKIDKKALPSPVIAEQEIIRPQTARQQELFDLIAAVLGTDHFGITTDLFTVGMTSLLAIKITVAIYRQCHVNIKTNDIIKSKTIEKIEQIMKLANSEEVVCYKKRECYLLTENQRGIYYEWEKQPTALQYNLPYLLAFSSKINPQKLQEAVLRVMAAHSYLNTYLGIQEEQIVQMENRHAVATCTISKSSQAAFEDRIKNFVAPFVLFTGPLYRLEIHYTETHTYLLADFHHIIFDGGSLQLFFEELTKAYDELELIPESYTAFDLALDEEKNINSAAYLAAEKFFDQNVSDHMTKLPKCSITEGNGQVKHVLVTLGKNSVNEFCKTHGITPNNLFLAALGYTLSKSTAETEVCIATITNGRRESKLVSIMGMLVKTVPVLMNIEQNTTAIAFIKQMQEKLFEIFEHDMYPFTKIAAKHKLVPEIMYAYQGGVLSDLSISTEQVDITELTTLNPKFSLAMNVYGENGGYQIDFEYDDSLYNQQYINHFGVTMLQCVNEMTAHADKPLKELKLLSPADESRLLQELQGDYLAYDKEATFLDQFAKQVAERPDKLALVDITSQLTYGQTNAYSDELAKKIVALGVGANSFIGIMLPRQKEFMVSVLAVMKANGAYLPLDSSYPKDRIEYMLQDSEAQVLITQRALFEEKGGYDSFSTKNIIFIDEFDFLAPAEQLPPVKLVRPVPDSLAYMIYTSGSTGKPKGVMISHQALAAFLAWRVSEYELTCEDNIACHSSFSFDASVYDLFPPLAIGGQLHIINDEMRYDMRGLHEYIGLNKITHSIFTTQFGMELIRQFDVPLKTITLGGEKLKNVPKRNLKLINGYGPTEFTVASSIYQVDQNKEYDNIPIGKPVPNSWAYVVDSNQSLLPMGMPGELCLAGLQIAKGYWKRPELTAEKFVDNPYKTCADNAKMYHTGDLVRWNEQGEIEYFGRIDNQVKLRGFRIELGEIEAVIGKFDQIIASAVDIKEINSVQHLCGYFTAQTQIDVHELKEFLSRQLTEYMVPTALVQMDKIPLTPNGKVDKKSLPAPDLAIYHEYVAPTSELEGTLCDIFALTLNLDKVGIHDSFFDIGGTSLLATKIVIKAMNAGINISYADVFKHQTSQKLAQYVTNKVADPSSSNMDAIINYDYSMIDQRLTQNVLRKNPLIDGEAIGDMLLTGATGFLGIHVLHEFLKNYSGKVYCLIRPKANLVTEMRLKSLLVYYFDNDYSELFGTRIFVIEGDMADRGTLQSSLKVKVNTVINCAANVKHFAAGNAIENINVGGVINLIDYCLASGARLIQVSTTSIAGDSIDNVPPADTVVSEAQLYVGQNLENKYINSKFLAERHVLAAANQGLDVKIMRVGNLMSRDADGEFQINVHGSAYMARLKAYKLLGKFPLSEMGYEQEFSPIDSTAAALLKLTETNKEFTIFHPCNNHIIYLADVIYAMKEYGFAIEIVSDEEYDAYVQKKMKDDKMAKVLAGILAYNSSNISQKISPLGTTNKFTTNVLYHLGYKWPVTSESYIKRGIAALDGLGFFDEESI